MKTLLALLRSLAGAIDAFVAAGGVQILVDYLRQRAAAASSQARAADAQRLDRELASGDPARVERAAVELLHATEGAHHRGQGAGAGSGQQSGHSDPDASPVPQDGPTLEGLQSEASALGLVD